MKSRRRGYHGLWGLLDLASAVVNGVVGKGSDAGTQRLPRAIPFRASDTQACTLLLFNFSLNTLFRTHGIDRLLL